MTPDGPPENGAGPSARAGLAHLQVAAREVVAAARTFLDLAEELLEDPRTAETVLAAFDTLADRAGGVRHPRDGSGGGGRDGGSHDRDSRGETATTEKAESD